MISNYQKFKDLHYGGSPLLLGNVWNVQSAKACENAGLQAIGTSSAAIAHSLGYEDGENMPFDEYFVMISRIMASTEVPLTVDLEAGYGSEADEIVNNLVRLNEIGIAGVNIEDSKVELSQRKLQDKIEIGEKIRLITSQLKQMNINLFINVRTDSFLINGANALNEAKERVSIYEEAGADGIFIPCIKNERDIKEVIGHTKLPINVMCVPGLPDFERLNDLGVKRISMGNFLNVHIYDFAHDVIVKIIKNKSFSSLFHPY